MASCSGIKVRPTGHNDQYPPVLTSGNPQGFHIDADLGYGEILSVDIETNIVLADAFLYSRWEEMLLEALLEELSTLMLLCMRNLSSTCKYSLALSKVTLQMQL